jgi:hypothetical protein
VAEADNLTYTVGNEILPEVAVEVIELEKVVLSLETSKPAEAVAVIADCILEPVNPIEVELEAVPAFAVKLVKLPVCVIVG